MRSLALRILRPLILDWLVNRALRLPADVRAKIAGKFGIELVVLDGVLEEAASYAVTQINNIIK